jgi:hypothetical protein
MTKTTHVIPTDAGWVVKKPGSVSTLFPTQKEAKNRALRIAKAGNSGQVIVHSRTGTFHVAATYGLTKLSKQQAKSKLGRKAIRRAVGKVVVARLLTE